jgi:hypothetical protein
VRAGGADLRRANTRDKSGKEKTRRQEDKKDEKTSPRREEREAQDDKRGKPKTPTEERDAQDTLATMMPTTPIKRPRIRHMIILSVAMRLPICRNTAEPTHINQSESRCSPGAYTLEIERARARARASEQGRERTGEQVAAEARSRRKRAVSWGEWRRA